MIDKLTQPSKIDPKEKAIASLTLGIVSGGLIIILIIPLLTLSPPPMLMPYASLISFIVYIGVPFTALIGLILGVLGLKSTKRNFAIAGIILCLIGLIVPLYSFFLE